MVPMTWPLKSKAGIRKSTKPKPDVSQSLAIQLSELNLRDEAGPSSTTLARCVTEYF